MSEARALLAARKAAKRAAKRSRRAELMVVAAGRLADRIVNLAALRNK